MNQLLDLLPVAVFVAVFFATDIFYATAALMVCVAVQALIYLVLKKPLSRELKITFWASLLFGSLTLLFRDETFIIWKTTVINWLLASVLVGSHFLARKNAVQFMLGRQMSLHHDVWTRLNFGWALGFFFAGALNLVVAYNFSLEVWVSYKLIGGFGLTLLYIVITIAYLTMKGHLKEGAVAETRSGKGEPSSRIL